MVWTVAAAFLVASFAAAAEDVTRGDVDAWMATHRATPPAFSPGDHIGSAGLEQLRPFLPPVTIDEFNFPELAIEIAAPASYPPHPVYREASLRYAGQCQLGERGELLHYRAGRPFSDAEIRAAQPRAAGTMIAWNHNFRWQHYGGKWDEIWGVFLREGSAEGGRDGLPPDFIAGGGVIDRVLHYGFQRVYHSHLAQLRADDYRLHVEDAGAIEFKDYVEFYEPFELRELKIVVERPNAPFAEDQAFSYMPNERRTRRLSPKERRDAWMGSEMTMDDFYGFSGRVPDYEWRLLGEHRILAVINSRRVYPRYHGPHSRVADDRYELRPVWVVEAIPRDPEHPYSSRVVFVDQETSTILSALMFDREERLWKGFYKVLTWSENERPDTIPDRGTFVLRYTGAVFVDHRSGKSTVNIQPETSYPSVTARQARRMFSDSNLTQGR